MQKLLFAVCLLLLFSSVSAQQKDGRYVRANQNKNWTLSNLLHYRTAYQEASDEERGSGQATAYYDTLDQIVLIQTVWLKTVGRSVRNIFLEDDQIYLIENQEVSYEAPTYYTNRRAARQSAQKDTALNLTETITHQVYLDSDTAYRWIGPNGVIVNTTLPVVQDTARVLIDWSKDLFKKFE